MSSNISTSGLSGIKIAANSIRPERISILDDANRVVHGDRQTVYGHPMEDFTCVAAMWTAYLKKKYNATFEVSPQDIPNMQIMVKVTRLAQTPDHRDSKVDIAGYAETADMVDFRIKNPF